MRGCVVFASGLKEGYVDPDFTESAVCFEKLMLAAHEFGDTVL
jgi:hypothetical protein